MQAEVVWIDGELKLAEEALIRADSPGVLLGIGVFETLLWGKHGPELLSRHWRRLISGLARLGLPEVSQSHMQDALWAVYSASASAFTRLRFTVLLGPSGKVHTVATCAQPTQWPEAESIMISPWKHNELSPLAGIKSISYASNLIAHRQSVAAGFGDAIMLNTRGEVCECTGSNLFVVTSEGRLITPALSSGCLPGVTREVVLETMPSAVQGVIQQTDVETASEIFLTSSTRRVQAVGRVGDRELPVINGPFTQTARQGLLRVLSAP